jgi:uncharacterized membrane protein YgaE (UPF0421/DUF939 family)
MSDLDKAYESEAIKNERQIMAIRKELQNANNDLAKYQIIFFTNPNLDQFFLIKLLDNIASLASRLKIKLVSVSKSSTIIMAPMTTKEPFYPKKSSYLFFGWIVGVFVGIVLNNLYRRLRNIS